ncbi:MAG TPA: F0F1 ATP synthase subunit A [Polaromonas sp.]|uniref:F0F1 ATP synthase subunit A n=1 Tax=Polaromonas sp. TaxID=1869339 RepID=UPI002D6742AF|nr:F0F1 ATP synthase subunit A [Polaromonas sp.]HYW57190.1 F0F1 ATP synthase subunit A [Polaromonas sp.]
MAADPNAPSASEYIVHHLTHWQNKPQTEIVDFSVFNLDSIFFSILLGVLGCFFLWKAARRATSGVPGRFQAAVEILVEMVESEAKGIVHNANSRKLVAPLALTIFVWIFLLNAMDLLPLDFLPEVWKLIVGATGGDVSHAYMRSVPTADLSVTMGMSVSVLLICLYYNVKNKGVGGWAHELVCAPFGTSKNPIFAVILGVVNLSMQLIEFVAKTVSHGMRLFGNMYAGELVFMLIALLGGAWAFSFAPSGLMLLLLHVVAGWAWAVFHILIITLQAFVFMMLTLVYIGQAHDSH